MKTNKLIMWSVLFIALAFDVFSAYAEKNDKKGGNQIVEVTARDVFTNIHTSALEILPKSKRLDMLDYWDVDSVYKASNVMEGLSWLEAVTPDYLRVHVTNVSTLEIKVLPSKKDGRIIMTLYTVGDSKQAQDSQVDFYNEALLKLDSSVYLETPDLKDFFDIPKGSVTSMKEIREMIPFPTIAYSVSEDTDNLNARLTVEEYINQDDWNIIKLFLKPQITAKWEKDKYKFK